MKSQLSEMSGMLSAISQHEKKRVIRRFQSVGIGSRVCMLLRRTSIAVAVTVTTLGVSAWAEENANLANAPYKVIYSQLIDNGYTSIHMIRKNPLFLSAFDRQGSKIRLDINPKTGHVSNTEYVHWMDN